METKAEDIGGLVANAEPVDRRSVIDATHVTLQSTDGTAVANGGYIGPEGDNGVPGVHVSSPSNNNRKVTLPPGMALYRANGKQVVVSPTRQSVQPQPCPVKAKNIKYYYVFSVISIVLFFPFGFPALVYAIKTKRQLHMGSASQNWELANKYRKRCQNCVIFAFISFFVTLAIVVAALEMMYFGHDEDYWANRFHHHALG